MGPTLMPSSSKRERRKKRWCGVRASLADLTLCDVKFKDPKEKAAASELVEDDVEGRSGSVGDDGIVTELVLWEDRWRTSRRWNCSALASAFSCVRTKAASCWDALEETYLQSVWAPLTFMKYSPSSESILAVLYGVYLYIWAGRPRHLYISAGKGMAKEFEGDAGERTRAGSLEQVEASNNLDG